MIEQLRTYRFRCDHPNCRNHRMGPREFIARDAIDVNHAWRQAPAGWTRDYPLGLNYANGRIQCETCPPWPPLMEPLHTAYPRNPEGRDLE